MKTAHEQFEQMLSAKNISKKYFANFAKIPYYTVAGWKKSGKVPSYAMVLLQSITASKTVTAQQLIDIGIPRAIFWNNDLSRVVPSDIFIVYTLQRAYNDFIIDKFVIFFGEETVLAALMRHRDRLSDALIHAVAQRIDASQVHA